MLDDLKYIHTKDSGDALGMAEKQWQQLEHEFPVPDLNKPDKVVFAGMGGSALEALVSMTWPGYNVPFELVRDYDLPKYVDDKTLVIVSSYSGNTEEAVSVLEQAIASPAQVVVLAGGGELADLTRDKHQIYVDLPKASQPRYAVFYALKALVTMLERAGLVAEAEAEKALHNSAEFLREEVKNWLPDVPTSNNPAKRLARELVGKSPVVYAGKVLASAAYKWKISFNENAKNVAWWGQYPEFNHNEFMGWSSHPHDKPYEVIDLRSSFDHPRVRKRFELSDKLLSGKRPKAHVVEAKGATILEQILWTISYGDFVSIYLALLNGVNPTPVDLIEKFKHELG
ncbi:bifunctional phosphoglucose/phosphomannose isomerase [Candidatus Saccharibacteria bacterium]|nr:bifunctional phosphoglucose/phosphomannose isomerase [Candidatus Saccharibacteria bacterium]MCB9821157.1 bifunctional phosphoglucose/phosphomannose isomerase [Candidatus Nomurabacteria bacterium]